MRTKESIVKSALSKGQLKITKLRKVKSICICNYMAPKCLLECQYQLSMQQSQWQNKTDY